MTAEPRNQIFNIGDRVQKVGGRYGGPGRIVGISEDLDEQGYRLLMVAMRVAEGYGEFVHVFPGACLRHDTGKQLVEPPASTDVKLVGYVGKTSLQMLQAGQNAGCVLYPSEIATVEQVALYELRATSSTSGGEQP